MANKTVTAANVIASSTATKTTGVGGEALDIGEIVYRDATAGNKWKLADADASAAAAGIVDDLSDIGLVLSGCAADGQPVVVLTQDNDLTHGLASVTAGEILILSATPGAVAPVGDLGSGMFPHILMIAKSATKAVFRPVAGPVAVPA